MTKLLSVEADAKTAKGLSVGYLTGALFMTPERLGKGNVCPFSVPECRATCIAYTGMGMSPSVRSARDSRRNLWDTDRPSFREALYHEISILRRKASRRGLRPAVRLNATSDILWEREYPALFEGFPDVQFYDYTKWPAHLRYPPENYYLVQSWAPKWTSRKLDLTLRDGHSVAVPLAPDTNKVGPKCLPDRIRGHDVIDGDAHDLIFLHPPGSLIGLRFKGKGGSRPAYKPGMFAMPF